jgi:8-oxo-dGTP pyrophosphatase MutT (NUDIX family)
MPISEYLRNLRARVGSALVLVPSVTGLIFDGDRVLLVRHSEGGVWVAPGGAVDPDEAPQDAVVRELWEETGLWVEPTTLCGVFGGPEFRVEYSNGDEVAYVMAVFECRRLAGDLRADREEILEARYFAASELRTVALAPWARVVLPPLMTRSERNWIPSVTWQPPKEPR